jgi:hypothetical protein
MVKAIQRTATAVVLCATAGLTATSVDAGGAVNPSGSCAGAQDFLARSRRRSRRRGSRSARTRGPSSSWKAPNRRAGQAQLPVNFNLFFDSSGHLLPGSSASLGQCTVDNAQLCGGGG